MKKRRILVFISYVREDYAQVLPIKEGLEIADIDCWMDVDDITPGFDWEGKIKETINSCDFFIACFSERYNKKRSTYMAKEVQLALTRHHNDKIKSGWIIPVLLSGSFPQLPNTIDVPLRMVQWITFSPNNWHISFDRLLSTINTEGASRGSGLKELERRFTEGKTNDRVEVLKMLSNVLDLPEALNLLEMGLIDPQESVRITALQLLTQADEAGAKILACVLKNPETQWDKRLQITGTLGLMGKKAAVAVPTIIELLDKLIDGRDDSVLMEPTPQDQRKLFVSEISRTYAATFIELLGYIGEPIDIICHWLSKVKTSASEVQTAIQETLHKLECQ